MSDFQKLKLFMPIVFKISKAYVFLLIGNSIFSTLQILANVILPKFLIDELIGAMDTRNLIIYGGAIVLSNLVFALLANTMTRALNVKTRFVNSRMTEYMGDKIMNVEYRLLEDPYYLDLKERALFACKNQGAMLNLVTSCSTIVKSAVTIVSLIAVMATLSLVFVLVLLATVIVSILIYSHFKKFQVEFFDSLIPINRRYGYYVGSCYATQNHKDYRLYSMGSMVGEKVYGFNTDIVKSFKRLYKKQGRLDAINALINVFRTAIVYGYVGLRVVTDSLGARIGLGSFTMYVSSAVSFAVAFNDLFDRYTTIRQMLSYLTPMAEFLSLPDESNVTGDVHLDEVKSLEFKHVTFSYPKSKTIVLDDISFSVNKGDKISIVGLNGAGKTTLVKLICRLYKPSQGTILINGRDIYEYEHASYMRTIAAVFQDYKLFNYSITENITGKKTGDERMERIIDEVGLREKISELKQGANTLIGKEYDESGIDLSGGQKQKIAIARALYKDASLIILDEPTSALDPIAEADIYENFNSMVENKSALYISHRMSSSVFCDKILVIDGGRVSDFDSHANLMKKPNCLYAKLFNSQAENYKLDNTESA